MAKQIKRIFLTRKKNMVLIGKYKGRHISKVRDINYLLWVQKNLYPQMSYNEAIVFDTHLDSILSKVKNKDFIEMIVDKKIEKELYWLKQ